MQPCPEVRMSDVYLLTRTQGRIEAVRVEIAFADGRI
jgi:hypothetical protein